MTMSPGRAGALALTAVLVAACSTSVAPPPSNPVALMPPPPPSPSIAAPAPATPVEAALRQRQHAEAAAVAREVHAVELARLTGRRAAATGLVMGYMPRPMAIPAVQDRFPEKEANKSLLVAEHPVSTFSADVDTSSYAVVRRMLNEGRVPAPGAVRVEEMVNYFPYKYAGPASRSEPFQVSTQVMPSPWKAGNQLVHIAVRGYDIQAAERPRANIVLLVDVSGSMQPADRLPLLQKGFHLFAQQLRDEDTVSIVSYANGTRIVLEPTAGRDRHKIIDAIDALAAGGGTAGGEGLQKAYALAERNFDPKAVNRVILATDGDFNLGITDPKLLEKFVAGKRRTGIYLSILGVGQGNLNDALMQRLAQSGNGNAAYIDSLLEARKAMSEQVASTMFPIANDVKLQVEFNPDQVAAYRLIGYETRMLERQDFNDDKVDAGDMGSGHTVTAIYEITPAAGAGQLVDPLRYGSNKPAGAAAKGRGDELCFVKVRYKLPAEANSRLVEHAVRASAAVRTLDAAPDDQRFAVAVAAFAQRLRGEEQVSGYSYADIASLANAARGTDPDGYRAEFVRLVRMAESLDKVGQAAQL
jgi:Ca-activated chloride channel family protein